jgi:hypothetical protein
MRCQTNWEPLELGAFGTYQAPPVKDASFSMMWASSLLLLRVFSNSHEDEVFLVGLFKTQIRSLDQNFQVRGWQPPQRTPSRSNSMGTEGT